MVGTALPWFWLVWQQNGYNFIATFFINHHLARYLTPIHRHSQPFWFYLAVLPMGFFPWSCFLPSSLVRLWRTGPKLLAGTPSGKVQDLELFLWTWVFFPFLFFSFSESKLAGYILPVFPALALLAALEWERFLAAEAGVVTHIRRQLAGLTVFTFLIALTLVAGSWYAYETPVHGVYLATPLVTGVLWARREQRKGRTAPVFLTLVASMTVFAALAYGLAASNIGSYHSTKELALQARPWISQDQPLILYRCFHHTALYYTNYQATPEPIPEMDSLLRYFDDHPQQRYLILVKLGGLADLQEHWDLPKVSRRGAFYLVELVPPKPLGRGSRALSAPSLLPAPHRDAPPQLLSSQPDTDIRRTSSARIPPFESSNR
jgi:4-amino-4-deoxy-L-arabinose transferase-like glycosyltransferase